MSGTHRQHKASLLNGKSPGDSSGVDCCPLLLGLSVWTEVKMMFFSILLVKGKDSEKNRYM